MANLNIIKSENLLMNNSVVYFILEENLLLNDVDFKDYVTHNPKAQYLEYRRNKDYIFFPECNKIAWVCTGEKNLLPMLLYSR